MLNVQESDLEPAAWNPVLNCANYAPDFCPRPAPHALAKPFRWRHQCQVRVGTLVDIFDPSIDDDYVRAVVDVMAAANWHHFIVLTSHAKRLSRILSGSCQSVSWMPHIWWGLRVLDMAAAPSQISKLRATPAKVRFLSLDPLVEDPGQLDLRGLDWVTVGGGNRYGADPVNPAWVRSLRDQCAAACVPFTFRQWPRMNRHDPGRKVDGRVHDEKPNVLVAPVPPDSRRLDLIAKVSWAALDFDQPPYSPP